MLNVSIVAKKTAGGTALKNFFPHSKCNKKERSRLILIKCEQRRVKLSFSNKRYGQYGQ